MPSDLPTRYTALAAKRPELGVPGLAWFPGDNGDYNDGDPCPPMWTRYEHGPFMHAEAEITAHLLKMLPPGTALAKHPGSGRPCIVQFTDDNGVVWHPTEETDIAALMNFWETQP